MLFVDSLADDARTPTPGTFRWACETESGPRIVIFRVTGIIELQRSVEVKHGDLTIAAQTAPGDGVCLRGSSLLIAADNVIVRGLRPEPGDGKVGTAGQYRHALSLNGPASRVIIDHCSLSWGVDGIFQAYGNKQAEAPGNFTVQWCILSECLSHSIHAQGDHSSPLLMGGGNVKQFSFHHNLLAHNGSRNPRLVRSRQLETATYDWAAQAMNLKPFNPTKVKRDKRRPSSEEQIPMLLNVIGNTWIPGSDSRTGSRQEIILQNPTPNTKIYLHDNVGPHRQGDLPAGERETSIAPRICRCLRLDCARVAGVATDDTDPFNRPSRHSKIRRSDGAGSRCGRSPHRPRGGAEKRSHYRFTLRRRRVSQYHAAELPPDADQDGMPDAWEREHGLDPNRADSAAQASSFLRQHRSVLQQPLHAANLGVHFVRPLRLTANGILYWTKSLVAAVCRCKNMLGPSYLSLRGVFPANRRATLYPPKVRHVYNRNEHAATLSPPVRAGVWRIGLRDVAGRASRGEIHGGRSVAHRGPLTFRPRPSTSSTSSPAAGRRTSTRLDPKPALAKYEDQTCRA